MLSLISPLLVVSDLATAGGKKKPLKAKKKGEQFMDVCVPCSACLGTHLQFSSFARHPPPLFATALVNCACLRSFRHALQEDDVKFKQKQREDAAKLKAAKAIAGQKGPMGMCCQAYQVDLSPSCFSIGGCRWFAAFPVCLHDCVILSPC